MLWTQVFFTYFISTGKIEPRYLFGRPLIYTFSSKQLYTLKRNNIDKKLLFWKIRETSQPATGAKKVQFSLYNLD